MLPAGKSLRNLEHPPYRGASMAGKQEDMEKRRRRSQNDSIKSGKEVMTNGIKLEFICTEIWLETVDDGSMNPIKTHLNIGYNQLVSRQMGLNGGEIFGSFMASFLLLVLRSSGINVACHLHNFKMEGLRDNNLCLVALRVGSNVNHFLVVNKFFCGGRLIFGPDVASVLVSIILVVGPALCFCINVHNTINDNKENGKSIGYWYVVLIVAVALTCLDITFLFMTSSRDPGIVPRNASPPDPDETYEMSTPSMEWINGRTPRLRLPRTKDVIVNGHTVRVKYCDTCMLYRPPRASHCSVCNNCVQRFDHHVHGLRNYRYFYMFILTSTILCIYVFAFSWVQIFQQEDAILKTMSKDVLSDFLLVYCFITVWFVGGLTIFHIYLICSNQTTYENFRFRYDKENLYHKGITKNLAEIFLSKIPPPLNDFRAYVQEDDSIVMEPTSPNLEGTSKEKIDIEMGNKFVQESGLSLPQILENLRIKQLEDNKRSKEGSGASDSLPSPFIFEAHEDGVNAAEKRDDETVTSEIHAVYQL
ncbi:hypothetical protein OSB04_020517 [Centaurea solstitialis]|uniref:S-acyltransferase n=1 Tax=Centaurea solstitialis TaxID=347529 RepID=A0AA38SU06_9ASTR|nr:hypothetical protein OSB04_020517 [Centaurea solstitialis]